AAPRIRAHGSDAAAIRPGASRAAAPWRHGHRSDARRRAGRPRCGGRRAAVATHLLGRPNPLCGGASHHDREARSQGKRSSSGAFEPIKGGQLCAEMSHAAKSLGRGAIPYVAIILCGEVIIAASVARLIKHPVGLEWLILLALTIGSGWATLRIPAMPI